MTLDNSLSSSVSGEVGPFYQGIKYWLGALSLRNDPNEQSKTKDLILLTIESLEKVLDSTGTCAEQYLKIYAALLLSWVYDQNPELKDAADKKVRYFLDAAQLADRYLGPYDATSETLQKTWEYLIKYYASIIDTSLSNLCNHSEDSARIQLLIYHDIKSKITERTTILLEAAGDTKTYVQLNSTSTDILRRLEEVFGPVRFCVFSKESGGMLTVHRFSPIEIADIKKNPSYTGSMTVYVFDKPREYFFAIDHGSSESRNQIQPSHLENIIRPLIVEFIRTCELEFFVNALDHTDTIRLIQDGTPPITIYDYSGFITRSFLAQKNGRISEAEISKKSLQCQNAINICRLFLQQHTKGNGNIDTQLLVQHIGIILEGKLETNTLQMVGAILISHNETPKGNGFPYGLSRKSIIPEGMTYKIIQAHAALAGGTLPIDAIATMKNWGKDGYFDMDLLAIFLKDIENKSIIPVSSDQTTSLKIPLSEEDMHQYKYYIDKWSSILFLMNKIENEYDIFRASQNELEQNITLRNVMLLQNELIQSSNTLHSFVVTRHGDATTDELAGIPGGANEPLTSKGCEQARKKGEILKRLSYLGRTTPIARGLQGACIMCKVATGCEKSTVLQIDGIYIEIPCSSCVFTIEPSLTNPPKNLENPRYRSLVAEMVADNNTALLMKFLIDLICNPQMSTIVVVSHYTTIVHLIILLMNLLDRENINGQKRVIDNDTLYVFTLLGGRLLSPEEEKTHGFFFPVDTWRSYLKEVNDIAMQCFEEPFYILDETTLIELPRLHNKFIDFVYAKKKEARGKAASFIKKLSASPTIGHFPDMLRYSRIDI